MWSQEQVAIANRLVSQANSGTTFIPQYMDAQVDPASAVIALNHISKSTFRQWLNHCEQAQPDETRGFQLELNPYTDAQTEDVWSNITTGSMSWIPQVNRDGSHIGAVLMAYSTEALNAAVHLREELTGQFDLEPVERGEVSDQINWLTGSIAQCRVFLAHIQQKQDLFERACLTAPAVVVPHPMEQALQD